MGGLCVCVQLLTQVCAMLRWVCPLKPRCVAAGEAGSRCQVEQAQCKTTLGCRSSQPMGVKVSIQGQRPFYLWTRGMVCLSAGDRQGKLSAGVGGGGFAAIQASVCSPRTPAFKPGGPPPSQVQADSVA